MGSRPQASRVARRLVADRSGHTRIKLCGMSREQDIDAVNEIWPDLCGFIVDVPKSRRNVDRRQLERLVSRLNPVIPAVGVLVDEPVEKAARLADDVVDVLQLHGHEDEAYLAQLRELTDAPVIQAFRVHSPEDVERANASSADLVLLDSGAGSGRLFDWSLLSGVRRPYLLAGGLGPTNVADAVATLHPWGVDMSSGIETDGLKDPRKMRDAVAAVR